MPLSPRAHRVKDIYKILVAGPEKAGRKTDLGFSDLSVGPFVRRGFLPTLEQRR